MAKTALRYCLLFLCLFGIAAVAAQTAAPSPALAAERAQAIVMTQSDAKYSWTLQTPGKAGVVQVALTLRDAKGKPVTGKKISGVVWMPEMPMRGYPLELDFFEMENGEYGALVQYKHGGFWRVMAKFTEGQDEVFFQAFDFNLID